MAGYYKNPEATAACIDEEGWFNTGDIGHLDSKNYIFITGRKKNVIIASNGKNVFPEEIEEKLGRSDFISESMVWADETSEDRSKRGIYATIRVDSENVAEALGDAAGDEESVYKLIDAEIDKVNAELPDWKKVKHIIIKKSEFDKTTSQKIRRFVEANKLAD